MKKITQITAFLAALMLSTGAMADTFTFGPDGGAKLQGVLDGITTKPATGSNVDVTADALSDDMDSYWASGGSGGSIATIVIELAGYAGSNTFGVYDMANPGSTVQLFDGAASSGAQVTLSLLADGSVLLTTASGTVDSGINFATNAFGFYLDATVGNENPDAIFYSDSLLNADGIDHMAAYQGVGDTIQILPFAAGPWGANEYILAWEDLLNGGDRDYADFVVLIESITPVPAPGTLVLLGMALAGLGMSRRRKA